MRHWLKTGVLCWIAVLHSSMAVAQSPERVTFDPPLPAGAWISAVCPITGGVIAALTIPVEDHFNSPFRKEHYQLVEYKFAPGYGKLAHVRIIFQLPGADVGSASFDAKNKELWFSTAWDFGKNKATKYIQTYSLGLKEEKTVPLPFEHNQKGSHTAHPWISDNGEYLFFSSDRAGKSTAMDIYYCVKESSGWSAPLRLNDALNSAANELFPVFEKGNIHFASDMPGGAGGYDLYVATKESQWTEVRPMPEPYNSRGDDVQRVRLDDKRSYLCAGRNGQSDQLWLVTTAALHPEETVRFLVTCDGKPVTGVPFEVQHARTGARILTAMTDDEGVISLALAPEDLPIHLVPMGIAELYGDCLVMAPLSATGQPGKPLRKNDRGQFVFEFLGADRPDPLTTLPNPDTFELLTFRLEGQLLRVDGKPITGQEEVSIINESGRVQQTVTSGDDGKFVFDKVLPLESIGLRLEIGTEAIAISVTEGDRTTGLTVNGTEATYTREQNETSLNIMDENGTTLRIYTEDAYRLSHLYYNFGSSDLRPESDATLSDLATILIQNPDLSVVLAAHTDSRGSAEFNLKLSQQRAESTKKALVGRGVPDTKVSCIGYGESRPLNGCTDNIPCEEEDHALNRRTEIKLKQAKP